MGFFKIYIGGLVFSYGTWHQYNAILDNWSSPSITHPLSYCVIWIHSDLREELLNTKAACVVHQYGIRFNENANHPITPMWVEHYYTCQLDSARLPCAESVSLENGWTNDGSPISDTPRLFRTANIPAVN